jgi:hypothetical protein
MHVCEEPVRCPVFLCSVSQTSWVLIGAVIESACQRIFVLNAPNDPLAQNLYLYLIKRILYIHTMYDNVRGHPRQENVTCKPASLQVLLTKTNHGLLPLLVAICLMVP